MKAIKSIIFLVFIVSISINAKAQTPVDLPIGSLNCVSNVSPSLLLFGSSGGTSTITATDASRCKSWNITPSESWITVSPSSVVAIVGGIVAIQVTCAANPSTSPRSAHINVGGTSIEVNQPGKPATPTISSVTNNCGNSVLKRGTPPTGTTWYWQGTSCGTSTANSNLNYTVTSSGTYYLRARTLDGTWSACASRSITVKHQPAVYSVSGNDYRCPDGDEVEIRLSGSQTGVNYQLKNGTTNVGASKHGTGNPLSWVQKDEGTYTVVATDANSNCTQLMNGSARITMLPVPTVYDVTGGGERCLDGSPVSVVLNNSDEGIDYNIIYLGGIGKEIPPPKELGDGKLVWSVTEPGAYKVSAKFANNPLSCRVEMNGEALVIVNPSPNVYRLSGGGIRCKNSPGLNINLAGSQTNVYYYLLKDDLQVGDGIRGTGNSITWNKTEEGIYTVRAVSDKGCSQMMEEEVSIEIKNLLPTSTTGAGQYCHDDNAIDISITGLDANTNYSLVLGSDILDTKPGTQSTLTFTVDQAGIYSIRADNSYCSITSDETIKIEKNVYLPVISSHPEDVKMCENDPIQEVSFSVAAVGIDLQYQWQTKPELGVNYIDIPNQEDGIYSFTPPYHTEQHGIPMYFPAHQNIRCIVSNQCGQVTSEPGNLLITTRPSISLTATPDAINAGENSQLTASGGTYYKWLPSTTFSTNNSLIVSPENTTIYTVVATNDEICYAQRNTKVKVELAVTLKFQNGKLIPVIKGGDLNYTYSWTGPNDVDLGNAEFINIDENGEYTVEVSDGDDQSASASISINYFGNYDVNYVKTNTVLQAGLSKDELSSANSLINYRYIDGLGRPMQNLSVKASPAGKNVIQRIEYDKYGRESKKYLPYSVSSDGGYRNTGMVESEYAIFFEDFFPDDDAIFAETKYEESPLDRSIEQGAPGNAWQIGGATIKYTYGAPPASDVNKWTINNNGMTAEDYVANGFCKAGTLYVTITEDENGNKTEEYKNILGQVILTISPGDLRTYYIYDDFGLLRCVVPPKAAGTVNDKLCYFYRYDARKRMIEKKIPGAEAIYMVYDKRDRLVLTQDGNMRSKNQWMYTKYDNLNRPNETGIYTHGVDLLQDDMQTFVGDALNFPSTTTVEMKLSETYYDGYTGLDASYDFIDASKIDDFVDDGTHPTDQNGNGYFDPNDQIKGQITFTKTKVPETGQWLVTVNYYDDKYRVIQTIADNHLGGRDVVSNRYDFVGKVMETNQQHTVNGATKTIIKQFVYDHAGRLLETKMGLGTETPKTIATNTYNELGQLEGKASKDIISGTALVNTSYSYNIRGWMTDMDNTDNQTNDLFNLDLRYNTSEGSHPQYNGNISYMKWNSRQLKADKSYDFTYDNINRLTAATYAGAEGENYSTSYSYDFNGNIETLTRQGFLDDGSFAEIDHLAYKYQGNRLIGVNDQNNPIAQDYGFTDNGLFSEITNVDDTTKHEYFYDPNGNLIADYNKGIEAVRYNQLNLPVLVDLGNDRHIEYLYDAAGIKLQQRVYKGGDLQKEMDYVGNFVYENGSLAFILTDDGRLVPKEGGGYNYEYFIKDHLGNTRVVVKDNNGTAEVMQESHYYPFGMQMEGMSYQNPLQTSLNKYLYNGKELQCGEFSDGTSLDWYDYGARFYSPEIARWSGIDPLIEWHFSNTPYSYCYNNPINFIDPFGLDSAKLINETETTLEVEAMDEIEEVVVTPGDGDSNGPDNGGNSEEPESDEESDEPSFLDDLWDFGVRLDSYLMGSGSSQNSGISLYMQNGTGSPGVTAKKGVDEMLDVTDLMTVLGSQRGGTRVNPNSRNIAVSIRKGQKCGQAIYNTTSDKDKNPNNKTDAFGKQRNESDSIDVKHYLGEWNSGGNAPDSIMLRKRIGESGGRDVTNEYWKKKK